MQAYLEIWLPTGREIRVLDDPRCTIGRHTSNDLVLSDDAEVSRVHAVLERVGPSWVIRDLSSRNGTRVNLDPIAVDRPLADGDEVRIGGTRLMFHSTEVGALAPTRGAQPAPRITPRERDVLVQLLRLTDGPGVLSEPASTRDIAAALVVSEAAVKQHLANLYDKFGIHTGLDRRRLRLANEALRRGAVTLAEVRGR